MRLFIVFVTVIALAVPAAAQQRNLNTRAGYARIMKNNDLTRSLMIVSTRVPEAILAVLRRQ